MLSGFKTYIAAALVALFGALAVVDWNAFLTDPSAGWTAIVTAVIFAVLRVFTVPAPATPPAAVPTASKVITTTVTKTEEAVKQ